MSSENMNQLASLNKLYTNTVGGGGYGIVKTSNKSPYNKNAVKFLYAGNCPSAKKEYIINKKLYNLWKIFLKCKNVGNFSIVKPIDFVENNCTVSCDNDQYQCAVIMERLIFPPGPEGTYAMHFAFNGVIPQNLINTLIVTSKGIARGYFFDQEIIQEYLNELNNEELSSIADVIYRIGLLEGICIFGQRMIPYDAEYILTVKDNEPYVTMIDFGKFYEFNLTHDNYKDIAELISQAQEYNMYYHPYSDAIHEADRFLFKESFKKGMTDSFECFYNPDYDKLYSELMDIYDASI